MASSQVEIASSSPFGCVLRDSNRRDRCSRENNSKAAASFQRNLKELVRGHLHTCISVSSDSVSDENPKNHLKNIDHHHQNLRCITSGHEGKVDNIDDSSSLSSKQAKLLDQWAATQARELVSTIERQSKEAGFLISSSTQENSLNSASQNDSSSKSKNLGASSLVQIWEARLNRHDRRVNKSNSINSNINPVAVSSRISSSSSDTEIAPSCVDEPSRPSDVGDSATNEDSFAEWDTAAQSAVSSANFKALDARERERVRVSDIIRRLTSDGSDHERQGNSVGDSTSRDRRSSFGSDQTEQKAFPQVVISPRIRGRQAFNDLLLQMEKERHRELDFLAERRAVSRFAQRGRIQSLLRLRFLQRGFAFKDQQRPSSAKSTTSSDTNRSQGSTIMHLRERFNSNIQQTTRTLSEAATPRSSTEMVHSSVHVGNPSAHNQETKNGHHQEISTCNQQSRPAIENSVSHTHEVREDVHEQTSASSDVMLKETSLEVENFNPRENSETTPSLNDWDENETEEEAYDEQDFEETNYDWFSEIARPRSYWEDRRQAWYYEKLTTSSDNDEIRKLLERRTVSSFLASDLRDRIDQLMAVHVQRQVNQEEELDEESQERMGQLMLSFFERHSHAAGSQDEEQELEVNEGGRREGDAEEEEEEEEEEESLTPSNQYLEATDYFDQSSPSMQSLSPSPFRSWYDYQGAPDSEHVPTTPFRLPVPSQASNQDRRYSSSVSRSSIEMELIYDLKGHMEQLQHEMSELRKSMQSCIEMQVTLQNSLKQEVHPVQGDLKNSLDGTPKRRNCRICYEIPVDSFLYRCGHMCTCLKCAHELQQSSGKCPICRAPILDVVRAYMES